MTPSEQAKMLEERRARLAQLSAIPAEQAANLAALARENPSLSPGVLYAAGRGGIQPGTPASKALSQADMEVRADRGTWIEQAVRFAYKGGKAVGSAVLPDEVGQGVRRVAPVIKGISRGTVIGMEALPQTLQGAIRSGRANNGDFGLDDVLSPSNWAAGYRQSDLYAADTEIEENGGYLGLLTGDTEVDYGNGFFAGGEVGRRAGRAKMASTTERLDGKLPTYGRLLATAMELEPGNRAYNIVSGLADGIVLLAADPTSYVGSSGARAIRQGRLFAGDASRRFDADAAAAKVEEGLVEAAATRAGVRPLSSSRVKGGTVRGAEYLAEQQAAREAARSTAGRVSLDRNKPALSDIEYDPDAYYRFIGQGGYQSFLDTGKLSSRDASYGEPYFGKGAPLDRYHNRRGDDFFVEAVNPDRVQKAANGFYQGKGLEAGDFNIYRLSPDGRTELVHSAAPTREQLMAQMGAVDGIRKTVESDRVLEFLTSSKQGQQLVEVLAKETDFAKLYDATKGKVDPETLLQITSREMTGDEIIAILGPKLGRTARTEQKFGVDAVAKADVGVGGLGTLATASFKRRVRDVRMFGVVPERVLPRDDINATLRNANDFLKNAQIKDTDSIVKDGRTINRSEILRRFAQSNGDESMYEVALDMMELGAQKAMTEFGIDPKRARDLFRMYNDATSEGRQYWKGQVVVNGERLWANKAFNLTDEFIEGADGARQTRAVPHLLAQFSSNNIPLPDPRAIRGELSRFSRLLGNYKSADAGKGQLAWNKSLEIPQSAMEFITTQVFKPLVLLRPAFILRNQIDEQFRPAGMGLNSLFNHPVQYLQWMLTDSKGFGRVLASRKTPVPFSSRGDTDALGGTFDEIGAATIRAREAWQDAKRSGDLVKAAELKRAYDATRKSVQSITPYSDEANEHARAITGGMGNWRNQTYDQIKDNIVYNRRDPDYSRAIGEAVHLIYNDPIGRRLAAASTDEDIARIKAEFWEGGLSYHRNNLAKTGRRLKAVEDRIGADQYVDETLVFMRDLIGDSHDLRKAAASGRLNGVPIVDGDTHIINKRAIEEIDKLNASPTYQGPEGVLGTRVIKGGSEEEGLYNRVVNRMFYALNDVPVRKLSKSPVFRQRYYERMENLVGFMEPAAADRLIAAAKAAKLDTLGGKILPGHKTTTQRLQAKRRPGGTLTLEEADIVAKADALEYTEELFYSLHRRGQFFDAMSVIFPFGEVFKDSAQKYAQLVGSNPVLPYRLLQAVQGARALDTDGDGEGFFYTDEQTGEEMFAFPGSEQMLGALGQEGAGKFRAPVGNLNIMGTTVIPGFGPVVQIAASAMLPDDADFNGIQEIISPYGERSVEGGVIESFYPAWFQKTLIAFGADQAMTPEQERQFVQAQKDWMGYLYSTGRYNIQDPAGQEALMADAKGKARITFALRAMAQAVAPSPPSPEFVAFDKDGNLLKQFKMAEVAREIEDRNKKAGTPELANREIIETFGEQALVALVPNTKAAPDKSPVPPNREALEFWQKNKGAATRFPTVFGMFAPDEEGAEFDFVAYGRQLESGERVVVTPEEAVRRANQKVARMIYQNAQEAAEAVSPLNDKGRPKVSKEHKEVLRNLKAQLSEDFPGYSTSFTNDTPALLADLKRAVQDPQLGKTTAGQGLSIWLEARDAAEQASRAQFGVGWATGGDASAIREQMRELGERLSADFPGFINIYERALEGEMVRDN